MTECRNRTGAAAPEPARTCGEADDHLRDVAHFRAIVGHDPYPWQRCLYAALARGAVPDAVDIPTGLGKTACVLLALLARLAHPALPRRIVYVVDRRAIVDQTAEVVRTWIARIGALPALRHAFDACAAHPAERSVGLGVLRGGLADDGAWRLDPARPTVLVGTVDMVGSRLCSRATATGARGARRTRGSSDTTPWCCSTRRISRPRSPRCCVPSRDCSTDPSSAP